MKITPFAQVLLLLLALARAEVLVAQTSISFPDPNLEVAFRSALSKPSGELTSTDLQSLASFSAASRNITNLSGLEWATNLTWLALQQNAITNLTPISGLSKLTSLNISENKITQVAALAALTNLTYLSAGQNWIINLNDIVSLKKLQAFDGSQNRLTNIAGLQNLTNLTHVYVSNNRLTNIADLLGLTLLTYVSVDWNFLDITLGSPARTVVQTLQGRGATVDYLWQHSPPVILASATHLLVAANTNSTAFGFSLWDDLTPAGQLVVTASSSNSGLVPNAAIQFSGTNYNRTFTVTPTPNQTGATVITLTVMDGADMTASVDIGVDVQVLSTVVIADPILEAAIRATLDKSTGSLNSLEVGNMLSLTADSQNITNLSGIEWAVSLTSLSLYGNSISNMTPLAGLKWLSSLNLSYNPVTDWSAVSGLTNLTDLFLTGNSITNADFVQNLKQLRILRLEYNRLTDLNAVAALPKLLAMFATANLLTNLDGLLPLTNLIQAELQYNLLNVSAGSPARVAIQSLQNRGVWVPFVPQNQPPNFPMDSTNLIIAANGFGSLGCYVWDDLTAADQISLGVARSSDTNLLPDANLTITANPNSWSGSYLLKATPSLNQTGVAIITLTATDTAGLVTTNKVRVEVVIPQSLSGEPVNCTNLVWLTAGHPGWSAQTNAAHGGLAAFQSGLGSSWLETTVTGPGVLTFWWKGALGAGAPSEAPVGGFTATCRESGQRGLSSVGPWGDWEKISAVLSAGTWDLHWENFYPDMATNIVWLDDVNLVSRPTGAWIELRPASLDYGFGFMVQGEVGGTYDIESSTNLLTWSAIGQVTLDNFQSWFTDYNPRTTARFYRLRQEPPSPPLF